MARSKSDLTLERLADAAADVFTGRGYRLAQISEIARRASVSQGAVYLYCDGKESLFWLAVQRARGESLPRVDQGSIGPKPITETIVEIVRRLEPASYSPLLSGAVSRESPVPSQEIELRALLEERYDHMFAVRRSVRLIERCSRDLPDLYKAFYSGARKQLVGLWAAYLRNRSVGGFVRTTPDADVSARLVIETVAWFAMHRLGDPDGNVLDDDLCRQTVVDALFHVFLPPGLTSP